MGLLEGKKALIFGIANNRSIAWGIAKTFHDLGAEIGVSYAVPRLEKRVIPLANQIDAKFVEKADVTKDEEIKAVFDKAASHAAFKNRAQSLIRIKRSIQQVLQKPDCLAEVPPRPGADGFAQFKLITPDAQQPGIRQGLVTNFFIDREQCCRRHGMGTVAVVSGWHQPGEFERRCGGDTGIDKQHAFAVFQVDCVF